MVDRFDLIFMERAAISVLAKEIATQDRPFCFSPICFIHLVRTKFLREKMFNWKPN
jgi:hypothetical protein